MNRKTVFDAVRRMLGRGFRSSEVKALDHAIDVALQETGEKLAMDFPGNDLATSERGVALIKKYEGCELKAYPDPGSGGEPWTIGYGATKIDGRAVRPGDTITQAKANALLLHDIDRHASDVRDYLGSAPTTQNQFDALVSFHFNTGDLRRSTLLRKHLEGDYDGAAREFARWVFASGKRLRGLERRRAEEAALYREGLA